MVAELHDEQPMHSSTAPWMSARSVFMRFWPYVGPDRGRLAVSLTLLLAAAVCDTVVVAMFSLVVDSAAGSGSMDVVWSAAGGWMALTALGAALTVAGGAVLVGVTERFVFRLRQAVFAHLQRLGPDFHQRHTTGDLISRLTSDVDGVESLAASGVVSTVVAGSTAVFFAIAATTVRWQLGLVIVGLLPILWVVTRLAGRATKRAARVERSIAGAVGATLEQTISNITLVQAYGTEAVELDKLGRHGGLWWQYRAREARLAVVLDPITGTLQSAALIAVLIAGAAFIANGELTIGGLFAFAAYLGYLYPPLSQLGQMNLTVASAAAASERLVEILDTEPAVDDLPGALPVPARDGHLRLEGVSYRYPGSDHAGLKGVDLLLRPGELVLVTGASGAGKSTLTRVLLRFFDPDQGRVLLDGVDLRGRTLAALRSSITLLPQEPMLFDATVAENIAYGSPWAGRADVRRVARDAGAEAFVMRLPLGFDTRIGEGGAALSGGQRQRVAIARALLRRGPVLVLDEPTTGLDGPSARALLDPLRRLARGRTTLVVSHDLTLAPHADAVVVLDSGRVVERGGHCQLLHLGGYYARLWAAQHPHGPSFAPAAVDRTRVIPLRRHA